MDTQKLQAVISAVSEWLTPSVRVLRVGQLDAELLDQELVNVLKEPVNKALGQLGPVYSTRFDPEITVFIAAVLYKLSVWDKGATYGAKLQDLRYTPASSSVPSRLLTPSGLLRRSLLLHASLTIVIPYLHSRLRTHALSKSWPDAPSNDRKRQLWEALVFSENTHSTLSLLSFVAFLYDGKYRTLADRLTGMKLVPSRSIVRRNVSYEFMNRQMVWHSFTEFLIFLLPLLHGRNIRRRLSRMYAKAPDPRSLLPRQFQRMLGVEGKVSSQTSSDEEVARKGPYWSLSDDQCAICAERESFSVAKIATDPLAFARAQTSSRTTQLAEPTYPDAQEPHSISDEAPLFPLNLPYETSCGHIYCYVCLADRMIRAGTGDDPRANEHGLWECLRCEKAVLAIERVEGVDLAPELGSQDGLSDDLASDRDVDIIRRSEVFDRT